MLQNRHSGRQQDDSGAQCVQMLASTTESYGCCRYCFVQAELSSFEGELLNVYFIWEEESSASILKLNQKHATTEVIDFTQDNWSFSEVGTSLLISYRTKQITVPPHHRRIHVKCFHKVSASDNR
jgi:hypothetical protein